jgi:radical SAM superfamily enzyme YgiQ (UPF0313 family)
VAATPDEVVTLVPGNSANGSFVIEKKGYSKKKRLHGLTIFQAAGIYFTLYNSNQIIRPVSTVRNEINNPCTSGMKITFVLADHQEVPPSVVQQVGWKGLFHFGVAQLSSCLKREGHDTSLIHIVEEMERDKFISHVKSHDPDLLAFTSMSGVFPYISKLAKWAKEDTGIKTICGGAHPTLDTEETVMSEGIDIACCGEGESPLIELCQRLEEEKDYTDIANLWVKRNGKTYRNKIRPLIEDLDVLPDFDTEIFDYVNLNTVRVNHIAYMLCSRGCPFDCTFCCNHFIKNKYPNSSKYVRYRSVERVIAECKDFTLKKSWAEEFLKFYRKEISLPFHCYEKIDVLTKERVDWLKRAGCKEVTLGIQSGNETIRSEILNRKISDDKTLTSASWFHESRIRIQTENIIGFPEEDKAKILDTIKINARIRPVMIKIYFFNPFKYTRLYDYCKKKGYLRTDKPFAKNLFDGPNLMLPTITDEETRFCYNHFLIMMLYYQTCYRRFPWAVRFLDAVFTTRLLPHKLLNLFFARFLADTLHQNYVFFEIPKHWKLLHLSLIITYGLFITAIRAVIGLLMNSKTKVPA